MNLKENNSTNSYIAFLACLLFINIGSFKDFARVNKKWCKSYLDKWNVEHHSLQDAKNVCINDGKCTQFYDVQSKNETFILCGTSITKQSNVEGSTLFMKCKKLSVDN